MTIIKLNVPTGFKTLTQIAAEKSEAKARLQAAITTRYLPKITLGEDGLTYPSRRAARKAGAFRKEAA